MMAGTRRMLDPRPGRGYGRQTMRIKNSLRLGLGALVVPASLPLIDATPVQATDADSEGHMSTATVDLGTLQSCTANFSLTKENSRYVSFDLTGPLADEVVLGEDLVPVWVYDDGGTESYCEMEPAWNPESPPFIPTDASSVDFSPPFDFSVGAPGLINSDAVEFFMVGSDIPVIGLELDGLFQPGTRAQYLIPLPPKEPTPATAGDGGHIRLVPATADLTEDMLIYDPALPTAFTYLFSLASDDLFANWDVVSEELGAIVTELFSDADASVRAEVASYVAALATFDPVDGAELCVTEFSADVWEAFRERAAHPVFWEAVQDAGREDDLYLEILLPTGVCETVTILGLLAAMNNLNIDSRLVPVSVGTLPATGVGSTGLVAVSGVALLAGAVLIAGRRRRMA
jgi:LPXTG-motif cell wall-anchored protein